MTFIAAAAFFTVGAGCNGIGASWRTAREIIEASILIVFIVAVVTDFRCCSMGGGGLDEERRWPGMTESAA